MAEPVGVYMLRRILILESAFAAAIVLPWLMFALPYSVYVVIGALALGAIVGLAWTVWVIVAARRSLTRMNRIDTERCAECGYVLYGLTSGRCPECGTLYTDPWNVHEPDKFVGA